jgi:hypothetical protein
MPEDLPAALQKLKNTKFANPYPPIVGWPRTLEGEEKVKLMRQRAEKLNDGDLVLAMRGCGRDVVGIITGFLDNPDAEQALVARARLGDSTAKEKLEELLQTRMHGELEKKEDEQVKHPKTYLDIPAKVAEIVGALACISEPNEAARRFLDYIRSREGSDLMEDHEFFESLILLPTIQARRVIKAYLAKARSWRQRAEKMPYGPIRHPDRTLYPLRRIVGLYSDRQIAEDIFKIMLLAADADYEFESFQISPYFTGGSAELLNKGLLSENEDMRAWCVWQLRKIGYEWSREELDRLLTDESWKVRANAVLGGGKATVTSAGRDRNGLVRLAGLNSRY